MDTDTVLLTGIVGSGLIRTIYQIQNVVEAQDPTVVRYEMIMLGVFGSVLSVAYQYKNDMKMFALLTVCGLIVELFLLSRVLRHQKDAKPHTQ